ncbi:hydrolase 2, exosortase A system-associated [Roseateles sp.]|uniref:hydrolase 2, exosortase A system-associated n=1 Tax=Roseateles sp. TaxID=1971397 RepID=UPI0039E7A495
MIPRPDVFFLPAAGGEQRLCVFHAPSSAFEGTPRGKLLYLHPFAEEMNKSRRMAALACRALVEAGYAVLQIDLRGCGDSSADFGEASWDDWLADVRLGLDWLDTQVPDAPLWLWGLRAGCLLATETLKTLNRPAHLLLVQPPASGKPLLQQFLRLKLAADLAEGGGGKGLMAEMRAALSRGEAVEAAGYMLSSALALGLEGATLTPPSSPQPDSRVIWLELSSRPDAEWTPVAQQAQKRWSDAGLPPTAELLHGPAFWQTTEVEEAPALIEALQRLFGTADAHREAS